MNLAWEMLRANYKSDGKGRYKTVDAMEVAKHFAEKTEQLQSQYDIALGAIRVGVERIEQLTSGPGGIMEMKQTIANKEKLIAELENELAGRVVWTENYGQGSEPWLNKE
jgi:hypothetical protein